MFMLPLQCVCDWDDRDGMFNEVEGILRRQIKVFIKATCFPSLSIAVECID